MAIGGNTLIQSVNLHFGVAPSSCALIEPSEFKWTRGNENIRVYCELGLGMNPIDKTRKNFLWLSESKEIDAAIFGNIRSYLPKVAKHFDGILTHEQDIIDEYDNAVYVPPMSNYPWTDKKYWGVHEKTKMISCIASRKAMCEGHRNRHRIVDECYDHIDLFGGYRDSLKIGSGDFKTTWPGKEDALVDYAFSLVIENAVYDKYYTEKITDCFATGTIPIYVGTEKICEDFDCNGIIFYDNVEQVKSLTMDDYFSRIDSVVENHKLVCKMKISDDYMFEGVKKFL